MCDKNLTQREIIKADFPNVKLLICIFHAKEMFKREVSKFNICAKDKKKAVKL